MIYNKRSKGRVIRSCDKKAEVEKSHITQEK